MAKRRRLSKPPIVEALIDIRVAPKPDITPESFSEIAEALKASHNVSSQESWSIDVNLQDASVQTQPKRKIGERIEGKNGEFVIQLQASGFTYSRLKNYSNWESLVEESKNFWAEFKRVAKPQKITRIATRYINRLELPQPVGNLSRFLTAPPVLPPNVPNVVSEFHAAVTILLDASRQIIALFQQRTDFPVNPATLPIWLDIDIFQQKDYDINDDSIWQTLDAMREFKNDLFFESLTEETLTPYL